MFRLQTPSHGDLARQSLLIEGRGRNLLGRRSGRTCDQIDPGGMSANGADILASFRHVQAKVRPVTVLAMETPPRGPVMTARASLGRSASTKWYEYNPASLRPRSGTPRIDDRPTLYMIDGASYGYA